MVLDHVILDHNLGANSNRSTVSQPQACKISREFTSGNIWHCVWRAYIRENDRPLTLSRSQWIAAVPFVIFSPGHMSSSCTCMHVNQLVNGLWLPFDRKTRVQCIVEVKYINTKFSQKTSDPGAMYRPKLCRKITKKIMIKRGIYPLWSRWSNCPFARKNHRLSTHACSQWACTWSKQGV